MPSVERPISARLEQLLRDLVRRVSALERPVRRVIPAGDTLPTSPDEGEQFDLRFAHDGLYRRCTWRGALNGGNGAWMVTGEPIWIHQTGAADRTTPGPLPNMPTFKTPYPGVYRCYMDGSMRQVGSTSSLHDCYLAVSLNGNPVPSNNVGATTSGQWVGGVYAGSEGHRTIGGGVDVGVYVRVLGEGVGRQWRFGDQKTWRLGVHIVELRP